MTIKEKYFDKRRKELLEKIEANDIEIENKVKELALDARIKIIDKLVEEVEDVYKIKFYKTIDKNNYLLSLEKGGTSILKIIINDDIEETYSITLNIYGNEKLKPLNYDHLEEAMVNIIESHFVKNKIQIMRDRQKIMNKIKICSYISIAIAIVAIYLLCMGICTTDNNKTVYYVVWTFGLIFSLGIPIYFRDSFHDDLKKIKF